VSCGGLVRDCVHAFWLRWLSTRAVLFTIMGFALTSCKAVASQVLMATAARAYLRGSAVQQRRETAPHAACRAVEVQPRLMYMFLH
jgi:hypothetical protein